MKKIFILLFILTLAINVSATNVSATFDETTNKITMPITKGWNLVPLGIFESLQPSSDIQREDFKYVYLYDKTNEKYELILKDGEGIGSYTPDSSSTRSSIFIYSEKNGTAIMSWGSFQNRDKLEIDQYTLKKGWNFIFLNPNFLDKSFNDIKGSCNIEKGHAYSPEDNAWAPRMNMDLDVSSPTIGFGVVIKVQEDCQFQTESIPEVPAIPN